MKRGRPTKPKYKPKSMITAIQQYLDMCNVNGTNVTPDGKRKPLRVPILKECCMLNQWNYDYVMQLQRDGPEELSQAIKGLLTWKEIVLEQGMLYGTIKPGAAIFSLKQLGWKDNQEIILGRNEKIEDDELTKSLEAVAAQIEKDINRKES